MDKLLESVKITQQPTENSIKIFGAYYGLPSPLNKEQLMTLLDFIGQRLNLNVKHFRVPVIAHLFTTNANAKKAMALLTMIKSQTKRAFIVVSDDNGDDGISYTGFDFSTAIAAEPVESGENVTEMVVSTEPVAEPVITAEPVVETVISTEPASEPIIITEEGAVDLVTEMVVNTEDAVEPAIETDVNVAVVDGENSAEIKETVADVNIAETKKAQTKKTPKAK